MEKISSHLCLFGDIGVGGNMYGGRLLFLMDEAAAIYARETTREPFVVTRSFSGVEFKRTVKAGEILDFYADAPRRGKTSFTFAIIVMVAGERCFEATCTFVAIDRQGKKKLIDWERADRFHQEHPF